MSDNLNGWKCTACGLVSFNEDGACSHCGSDETERFADSGDGELVSWSIVRVAPERFADKAPYAIGLVQLANGERLLGRLQSIPDEDEGIGSPVSFLRFEEGGSLLFSNTSKDIRLD